MVTCSHLNNCIAIKKMGAKMAVKVIKIKKQGIAVFLKSVQELPNKIKAVTFETPVKSPF